MFPDFQGETLTRFSGRSPSAEKTLVQQTHFKAGGQRRSLLLFLLLLLCCLKTFHSFSPAAAARPRQVSRPPVHTRLLSLRLTRRRPRPERCRSPPLPCWCPWRLAFKRRVEAAAAVDGFRAGGLHSLPPQLVTTQSAAEPRVRRLVLLIERSCRKRRGVVITAVASCVV